MKTAVESPETLADFLPPGVVYKDEVAKSITPKLNQSCGAWAIISACESGEHFFGKRIFCGKEWCEVCGEDGSASHKRRQARILSKIQQVKELGYFVIEFPDSARGDIASKAKLQETTEAIIEVLAGRHGRAGRVGGYFSRGIGRWHWFGDKVPGKWNPHFNVLVDSAYIEKPQLEAIKASLRAALSCPELIVHYSYFDKPGQMVQKVRYVTKATFRDYSWNPRMAEELFNFRNIRWWGSWKGANAWELGELEGTGEDVAGLEAVKCLQGGICPDCGRPLMAIRHRGRKVDKETGEILEVGKPVFWSRPMDSVYLKLWDSKEISGTGYYRIPRGESRHKVIFSPDEILKLEWLAAMNRALPSVSPRIRSAQRHLEGYLKRKDKARVHRANLVKTGQLSEEFDYD